MEIGLSLGSNLGDRLENLKQARNRILAVSGVKFVDQSRIYETDPVDVPEEFGERKFLNAVLIVDSDYDLVGFAAQLRSIERLLGRSKKRLNNEPRPIDIDIIYAGSMTVHTRVLIIPHPRWAGRSFVVKPLADVRPKLVIPGQTRSVRQILSTLPKPPKVVLFQKTW